MCVTVAGNKRGITRTNFHFHEKKRRQWQRKMGSNEKRRVNEFDVHTPLNHYLSLSTRLAWNETSDNINSNKGSWDFSLVFFSQRTHASCFLIRNIFTSGGIFSHSFHFGLSIEIQKRTRIPFSIFEQRAMWYACKLYIHRRHSVSAFGVYEERGTFEQTGRKRRKVCVQVFYFSLRFARSLWRSFHSVSAHSDCVFERVLND